MRGRPRTWLLVGVLAVAACGSSAVSRSSSVAAVLGPARSEPSVGSTGSSPAPRAGSANAVFATRPSLAIALSPIRLPTPTSRAVAFSSGSSFLVAGGLTSSGTTGRVIRVPIDGQPAVTVGRLAHPVHDAGGARLRGSMLVVGGGASTQDDWVQRVAVDGRTSVVGGLPSPRADLAAVAVGDQVVVVGGGAAGLADARVLATRDGAHFRVVARLPIPVRYAAVAVVGSTVFVIGGTSSAGDTAVIQSVDVVQETAAVVGRLPRTVSHATALVVGGMVVVAGGRRGGRPLDGVFEVDPASWTVRTVGRLPRALSDAAGVVVAGVGYLVGGEADRPLATVVTIATV